MSRPVCSPHQCRAAQERLEARIADLTRALAGRSWEQGPIGGLSPQQTMIVALIAKRGRVARETVSALLGHADSAYPRQTLWDARARLEAMGITVHTIPGYGWEMDLDSRLCWKRLAATPVDLADLDAAEVRA